MESIYLNVEAVNTHRDKPEVRKPDSHFTYRNIHSNDIWKNNKTKSDCDRM